MNQKKKEVLDCVPESAVSRETVNATGTLTESVTSRATVTVCCALAGTGTPIGCDSASFF